MAENTRLRLRAIAAIKRSINLAPYNAKKGISIVLDLNTFKT